MEGEAIEASEFAALMLFIDVCEAVLPLLPPEEFADWGEAQSATAKNPIAKGVERLNQCIRHVHVEAARRSFPELFHPHPTPDCGQKKRFSDRDDPVADQLVLCGPDRLGMLPR